jgi:hypothetical protein
MDFVQMFALVDLDRIRSPRIHGLRHYWESKRAGRSMPDRDDIDPADLIPLLPHLMIVEAEPQPFRVRYRLAGTKVVEMNRIELTGRYLDELVGNGTNYAMLGLDAYRRAWSQECPVYGTYDWPAASGAIYEVEFAIFPLALAGTAGQFIALEDWEISGAETPQHDLPLPFAARSEG